MKHLQMDKGDIIQQYQKMGKDIEYLKEIEEMAELGMDSYFDILKNIDCLKPN